MDSLGPREPMLASVDDAIAAIQRAARAKESGQHGLFFSGGATEPKVHFELREAAPWTEEERLASEYAMLGFYISGHPLEKYAFAPERSWRHFARRSGRPAQRQGNRCCWPCRRHAPMRSKKGRALGHLYLAGHDWRSGILAFPESFARLENILKPGQPLLLKARVQVEEAGTRLSLQEARSLNPVPESNGAPAEFRVKLDLQRLNEGRSGSARGTLRQGRWS